MSNKRKFLLPEWAPVNDCDDEFSSFIERAALKESLFKRGARASVIPLWRLSLLCFVLLPPFSHHYWHHCPSNRNNESDISAFLLKAMLVTLTDFIVISLISSRSHSLVMSVPVGPPPRRNWGTNQVSDLHKPLLHN